MEERTVSPDEILDKDISDHYAKKQCYKHDKTDLMAEGIVLNHETQCEEDPDKT